MLGSQGEVGVSGGAVVWGLGFRVEGLRLRLKFQGSGFRVQG